MLGFSTLNIALNFLKPRSFLGSLTHEIIFGFFQKYYIYVTIDLHKSLYF